MGLSEDPNAIHTNCIQLAEFIYALRSVSETAQAETVLFAGEIHGVKNGNGTEYHSQAMNF